MKKTLEYLGLVSAIAALVLSSSKFYQLFTIPIFLALICLIILVAMHYKKRYSSKFIQYISLLSLITLGFFIHQTFTSDSHIDRSNPNFIKPTTKDPQEKAKDSTL